MENYSLWIFFKDIALSKMIGYIAVKSYKNIAHSRWISH